VKFSGLTEEAMMGRYMRNEGWVGIAGDIDSRCRLLDSAVMQQSEHEKVEVRIQRLLQEA
jgi:hypothetical protein